MKAIITIVAATAVLAMASPAAAQSAFDGTWKIDTSSGEFGGKPSVRLLKDGIYRCSSCSTPWSAPADGAFHPITGDPYADDVSVTVIDPTAVKFAFRKGGKINDEETFTASPDGKLLTIKGTDTSAANGTPVSYESQQTRLGPAPAGAHAISGDWRTKPGANVSAAALTVTMKTQGDVLTMTYPTGESLTATFGGPAAPVVGDIAKPMVKLVRTGPSSFTSTSTRDGKVISVATVTVKPDGRTLTYASDNKENGHTVRYTATKQ